MSTQIAHVGAPGQPSGAGGGDQGPHVPRLLARRTVLRWGLGAATAGLAFAAGDAFGASGLAARAAAATGSAGARIPPSGPVTTAAARRGAGVAAAARTETGAGAAGAGSAAHELPHPALRYFGPTEDKAVYLTIDDGWFPDPAVLDMVRSEKLPITTFLIAEAATLAPERLAFWKAFARAGGTIENHTLSHPWLTRLPAGEVEAQWERTSVAFRKYFGYRPTLGRPPYGAVDEEVSRAAGNAGLVELVMWSALDAGEGIQTWNGGPLAAGSIVLMHWDPGLTGELRQVLAACERQGLVPRPLPQAAWA